MSYRKAFTTCKLLFNKGIKTYLKETTNGWVLVKCDNKK